MLCKFRYVFVLKGRRFIFKFVDIGDESGLLVLRYPECISRKAPLRYSKLYSGQNDYDECKAFIMSQPESEEV